MASASQWEVVGKSKKSKVAPSTKTSLSKTQKKQFVEKMLRIEPNAPVKEDKTIYSALMEKEEQVLDRGNAASARSSNGPANISNAKKLAAAKKKKPDQDLKRQEKSLSLDSAVTQVDCQELEDVLSKSQLRFPDNQDVWLKDLASFLNLKLEKVKDSDVIFKGKSQSYPLELLPVPCQKILRSVVSKFSNQTLDLLFFHFVQKVLAESSKDQPTLGYKIFLQLLAHHKPDTAIGKINQYLELLKTHQNRASNCLLILWAVGQCGVKDLKYGLKVWLDLMLPALEVRQVAHYPVEYLEQLLNSHKKMDGAYGVISLREYFQILDVVFNPSFNLPGDLRKRLTALYPRIKDLAYGEAPSQNLRTFFPSYLARLKSSSSQAVKNEVLECLVQCLTVDKQSFLVWYQLYVKHLAASGQLLEHISHEWSRLSSQFDKKLLQETLRSFSVTNDEIEAQEKGRREGLPLCQAAIKELTSKLSRGGFPWGHLLLMLVFILASIIAYDVYSSPNLLASRSVHFLEDYGILALLQRAGNGVSTFLALVLGWLRTNLPTYWTLTQDILTSLSQNVQKWATAAELTSRPHRVWLAEKSVQFYNWAYNLSPETWAWLYDLLILAWQVLADYTLWIWKHTVHLAGSGSEWLSANLSQTSISKESFLATWKTIVQNLQSSFNTVWAWCSQTVSAFVQ